MCLKTAKNINALHANILLNRQIERKYIAKLFGIVYERVYNIVYVNLVWKISAKKGLYADFK